MSEEKTRLPSLTNLGWRTVNAETERNIRGINTYLNEQYHGIKRTKLCRSEISVRKIPFSRKISL